MENEAANIYAHSRRAVQQEFGACLSGSASGLFAAVCTGSLSDAARNALVKSAEALGYGPEGVTFITIDTAQPLLDGETLMRVIEGLDPVCLVCADAASTQLVKDAYRCDAPATGSVRVFGREVRTFTDLSALMDTPDHKQQAWALLKTLPRL